MTVVTTDTEITLVREAHRAIVSPWGAALRRYFWLSSSGEERDIVWGYSGGANKKGGQGDVLIPFPGRIADGRYVFGGETFQLERNDKEGPNAIHGFVRALPWQVVSSAADAVQFAVHLSAEHYGPKGYPFSLAVRLSYRLTDDGLSCAFEIENDGARAAPVGAGFHPYFTVGTSRADEAELTIPAARYLAFNDRLVPTGAILPADGTEWDYRVSRAIGPRRFNHCYVDLARDAEGVATASLRNPANGRMVDLVMDRSFSALVVYTGDAIPGAARHAVAIEPMTCPTDAFNHPEWGSLALAPGRAAAGRFAVRSRMGPA